MNIHPEVAEPMIDQLILYYVWAGARIGLTPDWEKFRASAFYTKGCQKFKQEIFEKGLKKAEATTEFPAPDNYGDPGTITDRVIRDYVNVGMALGMATDWDVFRDSQFYEGCVQKSTQADVDKAVADAKGNTDLLNKLLPPGLFGKQS